jgi:hypothetical protein
VVYAYGLLAGLFLGIGYVVQQHEAAGEAPELRLRLRLLLDLARRPMWLGGIAIMVAGQGFGAAALAAGRLTVVEPLLTTNVLFALPLAAAWWRRRLGRAEVTGALALVAGVTLFVVAVKPGSVSPAATPWWGWAIAGTAIIGAALVTVLVGRQLPDRQLATCLGVAAGALFGLQDALTQRTLGVPFGLASFADWPMWALVAVAVAGLVLAQSAYQAAPLAASLPAISATEPVTGILIGGLLLAQGLRLRALPLGLEVAGLVAMVAGVAIIARSPVVAAGPRR